MKLGIYVMAPEPISAAYLINPYHQSVYMSIPLIIPNHEVGVEEKAVVD
jgi:hypothetical protein